MVVYGLFGVDGLECLFGPVGVEEGVGEVCEVVPGHLVLVVDDEEFGDSFGESCAFVAVDYGFLCVEEVA